MNEQVARKQIVFYEIDNNCTSNNFNYIELYSELSLFY